MGHGKRVQYYMGSAFFTITVRGVILSMFIRPGYSLADTKTVLLALCVHQ